MTKRRVALLCTVVALFVLASAPVTQAVTITGVPANETAGLNMVYQLNIPATGNNWNNVAVPYAVDNSASFVSGSFSRVAYYMQLDSNWVYVSFDSGNGAGATTGFTNNAAKLGVPTAASGEYYQYANTKLGNVHIYSNVAGIVTGTTGLTADLEFWPSDYNSNNDYGVPGANGGTYDFGDGGSGTGVGYGSMQIHNYGSAQTLFAYDCWNNNNTPCIGIGNQAAGNPDWTFNQNGNGYTTRLLEVFAGNAAASSGNTFTWDGTTNNWTSSADWTAVPARGTYPQISGITGDPAIMPAGVYTLSVTGNQGAYSLNQAGGTLAIGAGASLTLQTGITTTGGGLTIGNGGQLTVAGGSLLGVGVLGSTATISNSGALTADHLTMASGSTFVSTGGGLLTFSQSAASNTMDATNTLRVDSGELRMNLSSGMSTLGGAAVNLNGGTFGVSAAGAVNLSTSNVTVNASSGLNAVTSNASVTYGTLTFAANNATLTTQGTTGGFIFSGGTGFSGSGVTAIGFNTNSPTYPKAINDGGVARTITETGTSDLILDTVPTSLIGTTVFKVNSGRLVVIGNSVTNTAPLGSSSVQLNGGTLGLTSTSGGYPFTAFSVLTSSTLSAGQYYTGVANQTISLPNIVLGPAGQTLTLATANGYTFNINGSVSGAGNLTNAGAVNINTPLTLSGAITNSGTVNINSPMVISGTLTNSGTVGINATIGGTGSVVNSGNVTVSAALNNTGTLTNSGGTVNINAAVTGASSITNSGGTVNFNAPITSSGPFLDSGANVNLNVANPAMTGAATISGGTTTINHAGALDAASSLTVQKGGTLTVSATGDLGPTAAITVPGGTVNVQRTTVGGAGTSLSLTAGGTLATYPGASNTFRFPGTINSNVGSFYAGSGIMDLTGMGSRLNLTPITYQAGLFEGSVAGDHNEGTPNPNTAIQLYPVMGYNSNKPPWGDNVTWVYSGQMRVPASGQFSFAENIDDDTVLWVNGNKLIDDGNWQDVNLSGTITGTPGSWVPFEVRFGNGGGGAGPSGQNPNGASNWTGTFGFGYNDGSNTTLHPLNSLNANDYVTAIDNGSMNLFRVLAGGSTFTADAGATIKIDQAFNANAINLNNGTVVNPATMMLTPQGVTVASMSTAMTLAGTNPMGVLDIGTNNRLSVGSLAIPAGGKLTVQNSQGGKGGTFLIDGSTTLGAGAGVVVATGTTLGGNTSIPATGLTLNSGATLAPGDPNAAGTFTITGDFTLPTGTILKLGLGPAGTNDKLIDTGNITISVGAIIDAYSFGNPSWGQVYDVVDPATSGSITGLFQSLAGATLHSGDTFTGSDGNNYLIRYNQGPNGNDITLTDLLPEPCSLSLLALGGLMLLRRRRK